jgi:hypothetical protein
MIDFLSTLFNRLKKLLLFLKSYFFLSTDAQRPANKRRKRKGSSSGSAINTPPVPNKKRSPGPNFSLASQVFPE